MEKRLDVRMRKMDSENKRMQKIYEKFAKEVFKNNPKLIGLSITGIIPKSEKRDYPMVKGIYIENKFALQKGDEQ